MSTTTIAGIEFNVLPPEEKTHSGRGRKSPAGEKTGMPFNKFVFELLHRNAEQGCLGEGFTLTDNQLVDILIQEFGHVERIRHNAESKPTYFLSQLRSHFNRDILLTDGVKHFPSFSLNRFGQIISPDSGKVLNRDKVLVKLAALAIHPEVQAEFLRKYKLEE